MNRFCINRLTVIGPARQIKRFERVWAAKLSARYIEPLELQGTRLSWQFETDQPPLAALQILSRRYRELVLLLDYEQEQERIKGLARAFQGKLTHFAVSF